MKAILAVVVVLASTIPTLAITIPTVPVGNPGNAGEPQLDGRFGAVAHEYQIGTYEVTNAQYVEFLNSIDPAGDNALELYNPSMSFDSRSGIVLNASAADGAKYSVKDGRSNKPVVFVAWYDAVRFVNWLHNGQGSGGTEDGAYTLLGGTATPSNGVNVARNTDAAWFLPSENEWYKAAYYSPADGSYFDYPMSSNSVPTATSPPGPSNSGNFSTSVNNLTDVGAYFTSPSPYGAFDQGGNVREWNETRFSLPTSPDQYFRGQRGGSYFDSFFVLAAFSRGGGNPTFESAQVGFRVATIVPEPRMYFLLGVLAAVFVASYRPSDRGCHCTRGVSS
jgi:formylglycine-generating enzyme required for sulfatase activity